MITIERFLFWTPGAKNRRLERKKKKEVERVKIALLVCVGDYESNVRDAGVVTERAKDWLMDMDVVSCINLEQLGEYLVVYESLRGMKFIMTDPVSHNLFLTRKGTLELAKYTNYVDALKSYYTFLRGGRAYLKQFEKTGRAGGMYSPYSEYTNW